MHSYVHTTEHIRIYVWLKCVYQIQSKYNFSIVLASHVAIFILCHVFKWIKTKNYIEMITTYVHMYVRIYVRVCIYIYIVQDFDCESVSTIATALWNMDFGTPVSD